MALQDELRHGASEPTRSHLQSMGLDAERLQARLRGEGAEITHLHLYHCDHLGTPLALINLQGTIDWHINLAPWGNSINEHNPLGLHQPIRMQGQHDEGDGVGLFYNRHRYYDPGLGKYVSQDPIGLAGGVNNYQYGNASPINNIDPTGLDAITTATSTLRGAGDGVASYFKEIFFDLPKHTMARYGLLGTEQETKALEGETAVAEALATIANDPKAAMKIACLTCMHISPEEEAYLQGRLGGRLATAGVVNAVSLPVGLSANVGALAGNALSAGTDFSDKAAVIRSIILGGHK
ncbi:RHS repeat-associated core domain-containing protein [Paracidovorax valerianellae]|nr:RHS repeat-associated core domain-containing protein [Paracidovorax valerianellae]MDA8445179.1 RHS domain-containing protein [Paracidovorax valerianellae]